jgi:hypothetical protein
MRLGRLIHEAVQVGASFAGGEGVQGGSHSHSVRK